MGLYEILMDVNIDTANIKILQDFFTDLATSDQRNIFIAAIRKAVKPMILTAKSIAPYKTGNLRRSITSEPVRDEIAVTVGIHRGGKRDGWYGKFFEPSTKRTPKIRFRKKINGRRLAPGKGSTGKIELHPFIEPAYAINERGMQISILNDFYKAIDEKIIRVNNKYK